MAASGALTAIQREEVRPSRPIGWWGMVFLIVTEGTLFATLLVSYLYLRASAPVWPPGGIAPPDLPIPLIMTVLLLSSSAPMWWAEASIRRGRRGRLALGLAVSFGLGAAFLALQALEYSRKAFGPQTNVYGSLFFTITGFHGLHVMIGLLMNAVVQVQTWLGHFDERRHLAVQNAALYWHFVDGVWLSILAILYLLPRVA